MSRLNKKVPAEVIKTHNGAPAKKVSYEAQLRRSVMANLLWEDEFYESGKKIADRIAELVPKVAPDIVADMAIYARQAMNLRHVPLKLIVEMVKHKSHKQYVRKTTSTVISRADELGELLAMYYNAGARNKPLANSLRKGLADAFTKFNEYQLAKYNRETAFSLRDVLFLSHAKPVDAAQDLLWKKLIGGFCKNCGKSHYDANKKAVLPKIEGCDCYEELRLATPDTWEVALSAGGDKKAHWTRLLAERKLGALAILRNLRNMREASVDQKLIEEALEQVDLAKVLPYRYIAAAKYAPHMEPVLERCMFKSIKAEEKLEGKTVLLVDVSGSMNWVLSSKSDLARKDAAYGLAMLLREICEDISIYSFSEKTVLVPPRKGFALRDAIDSSQRHSGTDLGQAIKDVQRVEKYDRIIAITDEQSSDAVGSPKGLGYIINVASNKNGVGYGAWTHVDGFSEAVVRWIQELEKY